MTAYAELCVTTNFTFLTGASHPEEMVTRATELGLAAIAITDRNSLAGVVRAYSALKELRRSAEEEAIKIRSQQMVDSCSRQQIGETSPIPRPQTPRLPKLIVGTRLVLQDSPVEWVVLPRDRAAYTRLTRLLTQGKRRAEKGDCILYHQDLLKGCAGMILVALLQKEGQAGHITAMQRCYPGSVFLGAAPRYDGSDQAHFDACARLAQRTATPMVAVGDVLMHRAARRQLADVLTCMREHITIDEIGTRALPNAEQRLKGYADLAQLYRNHPGALKRTVEIAARCHFCLSELSYEYPDEIAEGEAPQARLRRLAYEGIKSRYPDGAPDRALYLVEKELKLVEKLKFPAYFLTVHDIVQYARSIGILCQGRGSAAIQSCVICWGLRTSARI